MFENEAAVVIKEGDIVAQIILGITSKNHYGMVWRVMQDDGVVRDQHFAASSVEGDRTYAELQLFKFIGNTVEKVYVANMELVIRFIDGNQYSTSLR